MFILWDPEQISWGCWSHLEFYCLGEVASQNSLVITSLQTFDESCLSMSGLHEGLQHACQSSWQAGRRALRAHGQPEQARLGGDSFSS